MFRGQVAEVSNREDVELLYAIVDADTGDQISLTSADVVVEVQDKQRGVVWSGSTDDGDVTLSEDTVMRILIPRSSMTDICAGSYNFGMTVTNAGLTRSVIVGTLTVLDGSVPA